MRPVKVVEPADLYFDDFVEGQELPTVEKGPMTIGHQVRWGAAIDNYAEDHYDEALVKAKGKRGLVMSGSMIAAHLLTVVHGWVGRNASVCRFTNRNTGSNMPLDTLYLKGVVTRKYEADGHTMLDIDCRVDNQRGENTNVCGATVRIAAHGGRI